MKIDQIQLKTNDIEKAKAFYQNTLGLFILEEDQKSITIQAGSSILKFVEDSQFNSIYHFAFNIPENQLEEAIEWCKNKVDLIIIEDKNVITDFEKWNSHAIYFYDTNGNLLEFIARHDLNNEQVGEFNSQSILNISEIGIVTENPLELGNQLISEHGLHFFSKNNNSETFAALGDDEGLLILVHPNRNWYPTQIPSQSNTTEISLENNENIIELKF
ncbi:VOC family protein [Flavobacterium reichenbachii]|uniref:Glyoxalase n=1 Tax=Flavobacterium reichenbachii TaxID=362418 RepID=A0A085ZIR6_9FLAO|nr:VOC family protein [Flavobacterium reichenbachii]KFF04330.1 glyoxalase [Flavobacterium reichenbachii]OXB11681.1 glyoxalase [Flavobacterium reichenbachii]